MIGFIWTVYALGWLVLPYMAASIGNGFIELLVGAAYFGLAFVLAGYGESLKTQAPESRPD